MTQEDVLRKIRGLLRLGQSDNPNESAAAIAMAQRLMEQYQIEAAMLVEEEKEQKPDEPIQKWNDPLTRTSTWKWRLASTLARANGCKIFFWGKDVHLIGRASNVQTIRYLQAYCEKEIDRLTKKYNAGNGKTWCNNFRLGCVDAIQEAIRLESQKLREELREKYAGTSALIPLDKALKVVDRELAEVQEWDKANMKYGRSRSYSQTNHWASAREAGRRAGASIYPSGGKAGIGAGRQQISG